MSRLASRCTAVLSFAWFLAGAPSRAQTPPPQGGEFLVNVFTSDYQVQPAVGLGGDGAFVVVWTSAGQDGGGNGVFAHRWSAVGVALATELAVTSFTQGDQQRPDVSRRADGSFVVVWESLDQDGDSYGVFARRFSAAGVAQATELQVNSYTPGGQSHPVVASDHNGGFVVAWESEQDGSQLGVFAQRFDSAGVPQASEFQVNSHTTARQYRAAVAVGGMGAFMVSWTSRDQDGDGGGVFARRFNAMGVAEGTELQVNSYTAGYQWFPDVAVSPDGNFVVLWSSDQDGDKSGVFARRFSALGVAQAEEFQVNTHTTGYQYNAAVAALPDQGFVVTWSSYLQDDSNYGVFSRRFDASGVAQAEEFQVNSYTDDSQYAPAIDSDGDGDFVVAWVSTNQDGEKGGIFAQRYGTLAVLDIDANGSVGALTDGLLVLRFLFGFTGGTLVNGAVDLLGCSRCSAGDIEAYLQTLL